MSVSARQSPGRSRASLVLAFALFQLAWLACVAGAAHGRPGLGIAAVAVAVGAQLALSSLPRADTVLIAAAVAIGLGWDTALSRLGLVTYESPGPFDGLAPLWILALWALFASVLREPMRWLHGRPVVSMLAGAIGGPMSYTAAQSLDACRIDDGLHAIAVLAVGWAVLTALLVALAARLDASFDAAARSRS